MERDEIFELYQAQVNAGRIDTYDRYGFDAVMGRREGIRIRDAYDGRDGGESLWWRHERMARAVERNPAIYPACSWRNAMSSKPASSPTHRSARQRSTKGRRSSPVGHRRRLERRTTRTSVRSGPAITGRSETGPWDCIHSR